MDLKKSFISLSVLSTLTTLSACGGSSSSTPPIEPTPAVPIQTVIEGKAIKGTIANAIVSVYKYVDGVATKLEGNDLAQASVITEPDGSYTVTINDYDGPIKIELSVGANTTMICDAPAGCGNIAFGDPILLASVDPSFTLSAISTVGAVNDGEVNINVSALTHLSAALIESDEDGVNAESIQEQSSIIANAFNISGNLTELEPTAVDNPGAVANEDNFDELRYGLVNAGIMSALFAGEDENVGVLSGNLESAISDLVANDGALLVNQDTDNGGFTLSLVDVLDGAGQVASVAAEAIADDPELASNEGIRAQLEQEEVNLVNQSDFAEANTDEDGRSAPVVEQATEGDDIAKAKAMVNDIRLFTHLFDVDSDANAAITGQGEQYLSLIDAASEMLEAEAASFLLLAEVADAITELSTLYADGSLTGTSFEIDEYLSLESAEGTVTFDEETANGGLLFSIDAMSADEIVKLNIEAVISEDGKTVTLGLSGSIESAGAKIALTQGSFAKVYLDSSLSRSSLEDDTFEGDIASGELELELTLAQKATSSVINPVTFTGLVQAKLVPIEVPSLSHEYNWNSAQENEGNLFRPESNHIILPEMLTLSGGFSSADGDLIKATLTANIKDLASYEAPAFEYIGAQVSDIISVSSSADSNVVTITTSDQVEDGLITTRTFSPGTQAGEWRNVTTWTPLDTSEPAKTRERLSRVIETNLDVDGFQISTSNRWGTDEDPKHYAEVIRVTPVDHDGDAIADEFVTQVINTEDSFSSDYNPAALLNENGDLITANGEIRTFETAYSIGNFSRIEHLVEANGNIPVNPFTIENGLQLFEKAFAHVNLSYTLTDIGEASVFFDEDITSELSAGNTINLGGILTKPLLSDVFTISVSDNGNTIVSQGGTLTQTYSVDYSDLGNYVFSREVTEEGELIVSDVRTFASADVGLDIDEVTISRVNVFDNTIHYDFTRITPVDENGDGITDYLNRAISYSENISAEGVLINVDGTPVEEYAYYYANSYDEDSLDWYTPFNPLTVTNGLDMYKGWLLNARDSHLSSTIDGVGSIQIALSEEEIASLSAGTTSLLDAYVTYPDTTESLENEDVFLDVNAALSLETALGDYLVNLTLSGKRTALSEGKFDLAMQYKLPDDEAMRKFTIHMKTNEEGKLTANNSEGVLVVLSEPEEDAESNVVGTIVVGPSAIKVADIEDRDGIIMIVYSDDTTETL